MNSAEQLAIIQNQLQPYHALLIAVSKTKTVSEIQYLYDRGVRDFGENKVQELREKVVKLPKDIRWHLIGHLQTNKVKYIAPYIYLIHSVDSLKLLKEIDKEGKKNGRIINYLFQLYIAKEETKFGLSFSEIEEILNSEEWKSLTHVRLRGLMAIATNTDDVVQIENEFKEAGNCFQLLKNKFPKANKHVDITELSMGMSNDYQIALKHGSTMIRIGSLLFGKRNYGSDK
jgi:pyridoxal phosphate enzyme (YggS family)